MNENRVLIVDGMALLFRAFYATAMSGYFMVNSKGVPTNAVHGFLKHLFMAVDAYEPTHVVCCWDMGSKTFRNEIYSNYKANRDKPPVELIPQFDLVKEVVTELNVPNVGLVGFEADDCIGTLSKHYAEEAKVFILTGDHDMLQLINDNTSVIFLKKGYGNYEKYKEQTLFENKGITPSQMIDFKALMGDSSDNYPGVKGIGEKTAIQLLKKYETIEGILTNISSLTPAQKRNIENDLDVLHLCRKLATIDCEVDVSCPLDNAIYKIDRIRAIAKFEELELRNLNELI